MVRITSGHRLSMQCSDDKTDLIYVENRKFWRQTDLWNLLLLNLY